MSASFSPVANSIAWLAPWLLGCVMRALNLLGPFAPATGCTTCALSPCARTHTPPHRLDSGRRQTGALREGGASARGAAILLAGRADV